VFKVYHVACFTYELWAHLPETVKFPLGIPLAENPGLHGYNIHYYAGIYKA